jgi:chromosome segregation ATPase
MHGETETKSNEIAALLAGKEVWQTQMAGLSEQNEQLIHAVQVQSEIAKNIASQNEALQTESNYLREQASQEQARLEQRIAALQEENEALKAEQVILQEQTSIVRTLEDEIASARAEIKNLQSRLLRLEGEVTVAHKEKSHHQEQASVLRQKNLELTDKITSLEAYLEPVQRALRCSLGRIFTTSIRLLYGVNLSELQQERAQ